MHRLDLYRKFHDYAWDMLTATSYGDENDVDAAPSSRHWGTTSALDYEGDGHRVPERLRSNASPVKNAPNGTGI